MKSKKKTSYETPPPFTINFQHHFIYCFCIDFFLLLLGSCVCLYMCAYVLGRYFFLCRFRLKRNFNDFSSIFYVGVHDSKMYEFHEQLQHLMTCIRNTLLIQKQATGIDELIFFVLYLLVLLVVRLVLWSYDGVCAFFLWPFAVFLSLLSVCTLPQLIRGLCEKYTTFFQRHFSGEIHARFFVDACILNWVGSERVEKMKRNARDTNMKMKRKWELDIPRSGGVLLLILR